MYFLLLQGITIRIRLVNVDRFLSCIMVRGWTLTGSLGAVYGIELG
jgi:hypothetical protein